MPVSWRSICLRLAVFLLAAAIAAPALGALQDATGLNPDVLRLTVFSTAVAAAIVWLIWRRLPAPATSRRGLARPLLASTATCALFAALMLALAAGERAPWRAADVLHPAIALPVLITGALFALGHAFMLPAVGVFAFSLFCVAAIGISVLLAAVTIGYSIGQRVALATLLHFGINAVTFGLFADGDGSPLYFADMATAATIVAVAAWWALIGVRLGKARRHQRSS
jgi:hypothetical protein